MVFIVIFLMLALLCADAIIFYALGVACKTKSVVDKMEEQGWKIVPPESAGVSNE